MTFEETALSGVYVISLEPIADERGFFARSWCREEFRARGLAPDLLQCNISFNRRRGTLRGMHYQAAPFEEVKLVRCTRGAIFDVVIDLRPDSSTFTRWVAVRLDALDRRSLYIPKGLAHGFQTLEDDTEVFYQMSGPYVPEAARGVRGDDPAFGIQWPIPDAVLSPRDHAYPDFAAPSPSALHDARPMKIFLTGATGFIGSHLTRLLVGEGNEVTALVRPGADFSRLADLLGAVRLLEGDLSDPGQFETRLASVTPNLCFHLAWYAVPGQYLHAPENLDCVQGSLDLLRVLDRVGCHRVVMAGTCFEYDTNYGYLSEASLARPQTLYAACKHALSLMAEQYQRRQGRSFAWARIFYQYGSWEDGRRLVPQVIRTLLAGDPCPLTHGEQVRDYLHVEDVARALWAIGRSDLEGAVVVGSSRPVTVADMARAVGDLLGRGDLLRFGARLAPPDDPPFLCANTTLLRNRTDWAPRHDLASGLAATIAWWQSRGDLSGGTRLVLR